MKHSHYLQKISLVEYIERSQVVEEWFDQCSNNEHQIRDWIIRLFNKANT